MTTSTEENKIEETLIPEAIEAEVLKEALPEEVVAEVALPREESRRMGGGRRKNERKPSRRPERAKQEFDNKIISLRRVTRVVSGGRRFSFSVAVVIGDRKGRVGVGLGKAGDTPIAVEKAVRDAKKNMITLKLHNSKIQHAVEAKYSSSRILIMKAPGKGIVAGSSVRNVLELAGVKEVSAKIISRSKNKINNARATLKALQMLKVRNANSKITK